jgi:tRNA uridine 5-carboxymethylaminomethyl modification enzyme
MTRIVHVMLRVLEEERSVRFYSKVLGLRLEAGQKLASVRPSTVAQASRISGVSPADISVLLVHVKASGRGE